MRLSILIMKRLFLQLRRDHRSLGLVLIAPAVFMIMFGIAFGGEIEHLPVLIINNDSDAHVIINQTVGIFTFTVFNETVPSIGDNIVNELINDSRVDITFQSDYTEAKSDVDKKKYSCILFIPENFTYNLVSPLGDNVTLEIYLDNSNPQVGGVVLYAIQEAFQEASSEFRGNFGLSIQYAYGENITTVDFFAPGMIAYGVFFFSFMLVIMNLIGERKSGTLSLLLQCPYDKIEIILGYLAAFSVVSMVQATIIMLVAGFVFQISFGATFAHIISVYIGAVVVGWTGLILAIFLSAYARSEFQAVQFIPLIILPVLLLSGIIIPLNQIPEILRWVAYLVPTTYGVNLLREISIEGVILTPFNFDFLFQLIFFIILLIGTRLTLRET